MKKIKQNYILILTIIIIAVLTLLAVYNNIKEYKMNVFSYKYHINQCNNEYKNDSSMQEYCNNLKLWGGPKRSDAFFTFFDLLFDDRLMILELLLPLLIIFCSLDKFLKKLKSGYLKNELTRMPYKKIIIKEWLNGAKIIFIIPCFFIILFIISFFMTGNINYKESLNNFDSWVNPLFFNNLFTSIIIYFLNFFLYGVFLVNIGFIVARDSKNIILTYITSYLVYFGFWLLSETILGYFIFNGLLGKPEWHNYFSFTSIWGYPNINNFYVRTLIQLLWTLGSFLVLIKFYKKKEKVLINNE